MKTKIIFLFIILLVISGCQSIKKTDGLALVVAPFYLPVSSEKEEVFALVEPYEEMSLYDFLKRKNYKMKVISNIPLIYEIPDQKGLLEELANILITIKSVINVCLMNIANANTTKTADGKPYRRKAFLISKDFKIVKMVDVSSEFKKIYDPTHPDADSSGYVYLPNVNEIEEQIQIIKMQCLEKAIITLIERINKNSVSLDTPVYYELLRSQKKWVPTPGGK
jgi:flagellar basal-body rod protein FlgC